MSVVGRIENGRVVFEGPVPMPEGTAVWVEAVEPNAATNGNPPTLAERLKRFLKHELDLRADAAEQHDHYLYGQPKR